MRHAPPLALALVLALTGCHVRRSPPRKHAVRISASDLGGAAPSASSAPRPVSAPVVRAVEPASKPPSDHGPRRAFIYSSGPLPAASTIATSPPPPRPTANPGPTAPPAPPRPPEPVIETIATNLAIGHLAGADGARIYMAGPDCQSVLAMPRNGGAPAKLPLSVKMMVETVDGRDAYGCIIPAPLDGTCVLVRAPVAGGPAHEIGRYGGWIRGEAVLGAGVIDYVRTDLAIVEVSLANGSTRVVAKRDQMSRIALAGPTLYSSTIRAIRRIGPAGEVDLPKYAAALAADASHLWILGQEDLARVAHDRSDIETIVANAVIHERPPPGRIGLMDSLAVDDTYVYWTVDATWPNKSIRRTRKP